MSQCMSEARNCNIWERLDNSSTSGYSRSLPLQCRMTDTGNEQGKQRLVDCPGGSIVRLV